MSGDGGEIDRIYISIGMDTSELDSALSDVSDKFESIGANTGGAFNGVGDAWARSMDPAIGAFAEVSAAAEETAQTTAAAGANMEQVWDSADRGTKKMAGGLRDMAQTITNVVVGLKVVPGLLNETTAAYAGMAVVGVNIAAGLMQSLNGIADLREGYIALKAAVVEFDVVAKLSALSNPYTAALLAITAVVAALAVLEMKTGAVSAAWKGMQMSIEPTTTAMKTGLEGIAAKFDEIIGRSGAASDAYMLMMDTVSMGIPSMAKKFEDMGDGPAKAAAKAEKAFSDALAVMKSELPDVAANWETIGSTIKESQAAVEGFAASHDALDKAKAKVDELKSSYSGLVDLIGQVEDNQVTSALAGVDVADATNKNKTATTAYDTAYKALDKTTKQYFDEVRTSGTSNIKLTKDQQSAYEKVADAYRLQVTTTHDLSTARSTLQNIDEQSAITWAELQQLGEANGQTASKNIDVYKKLAESVGGALAKEIMGYAAAEVAHQKWVDYVQGHAAKPTIDWSGVQNGYANAPSGQTGTGAGPGQTGTGAPGATTTPNPNRVVYDPSKYDSATGPAGWTYNPANTLAITGGPNTVLADGQVVGSLLNNAPGTAAYLAAMNDPNRPDLSGLTPEQRAAAFDAANRTQAGPAETGTRSTGGNLGYTPSPTLTPEQQYAFDHPGEATSSQGLRYGGAGAGQTFKILLPNGAETVGNLEEATRSLGQGARIASKDVKEYYDALAAQSKTITKTQQDASKTQTKIATDQTTAISDLYGQTSASTIGATEGMASGVTGTTQGMASGVTGTVGGMASGVTSAFNQISASVAASMAAISSAAASAASGGGSPMGGGGGTSNSGSSTNIPLPGGGFINSQTSSQTINAPIVMNNPTFTKELDFNAVMKIMNDRRKTAITQAGG